MSNRSAMRTSAVAAAFLALSGCAHTSVHDVAWEPVDGPMCTVRVQSDYGTPVEVGVRAGGREIYLGVVQPESAHELDVPCVHRAVTVYRVVRHGFRAENRMDAHARALDSDDVTVVTLRPSTARRAAIVR